MDHINVIGNQNRATNFADRTVWRNFLFEIQKQDVTPHKIVNIGIQTVLTQGVNVTVRNVFFSCFSLGIVNNYDDNELKAAKDILEKAFLKRLEVETERTELQQLAEGMLQHMIEIHNL